MDDSLRVTNLSKTYHGKSVVKNVSFTIEQGTTFALLGPNGAGKSTMIHMIAGLIKKTKGKIYVQGFDMDQEMERIRHQIGFVFQEDILDPEFTVYQNLYYRSGLYLKSKKERKHRIEEVLVQLHSIKLKDKQYATLSFGQKRMVQIARAIITCPSLLILDEPTAGLDPYARHTLWNILKKIQNEKNMTIFYTTHYMEEVNYAKRIGIIVEGTLHLYSPMELRSTEGIERLYLKLLGVNQ